METDQWWILVTKKASTSKHINEVRHIVTWGDKIHEWVWVQQRAGECLFMRQSGCSYSILSTFCKRGLKHKQYIAEATYWHDSILINTAACSCCICLELMAVIFIYRFNVCYFSQFMYSYQSTINIRNQFPWIGRLHKTNSNPWMPYVSSPAAHRVLKWIHSDSFRWKCHAAKVPLHLSISAGRYPHLAKLAQVKLGFNVQTLMTFQG